jgi:hypothetical protein
MPDLADIHRTLGRLESKVDILLARDDGFDRRLTKVEHKVTWFSGAAAAVGALIGWAVSWFTKAAS